jgi:gamma-tubulin complex component 2
VTGSQTGSFASTAATSAYRGGGSLSAQTAITTSPTGAVLGTAGQSLQGVDLLQLKYKVEWPLSVIVSKKALTKYQLMFRHLFFVKHVERQLLATWQDHQVTDMFNYLQFFNLLFC